MINGIRGEREDAVARPCTFHAMLWSFRGFFFCNELGENVRFYRKYVDFFIYVHSS